MIFTDRSAAGTALAARLGAYAGTDSLVIGLTRGGVPVAGSIAQSLNLPFDVLVVKKIGSPSDPELAIGALAPDGISWIDWKLAGRVGADAAYIEKRIQELKPEIKVTEQLFHLPKKRKPLAGTTVILTDDGAATGASMSAAVKWLRAKKVRTIVIAVPVMPDVLTGYFNRICDTLVALSAPADFVSVGSFYGEFTQVSNQHVLELLRSGKE